MAEHVSYSGPVEGLTLEEVAARLRVTRQWIDQNYTGPRLKLGRETRVSAKHLDAWLDECAGVTVSKSAKKPPQVEV